MNERNKRKECKDEKIEKEIMCVCVVSCRVAVIALRLQIH